MLSEISPPKKRQSEVKLSKRKAGMMMMGVNGRDGANVCNKNWGSKQWRIGKEKGRESECMNVTLHDKSYSWGEFIRNPAIFPETKAVSCLYWELESHERNWKIWRHCAGVCVAIQFLSYWAPTRHCLAAHSNTKHHLTAATADTQPGLMVKAWWLNKYRL